MSLQNLLKIGQLKQHATIDDDSVAVCLKEGQSLLDEARSWINLHRPELATD